MKLKMLYAAVALFAAPVVNAESLNIVVGDVTYRYPVSDTGEMPFGAGATLTVLGREFGLGGVGRIYVDDSDCEPATLAVTYDGERASVVVDGRIARYVEVDVAGADVSVSQAPELATELSYLLSGSSAAGSFTLSGTYKATIGLDGLSLASQRGAALAIMNGKRIKLHVADNTVNTLADASGGSQKGAVDCKGHLEIKGHGTLTVEGRSAHAIFAKEYLTLKNATVNVVSAIKDGVNCNQYFAMESGRLNIGGVGDDGLQVSYKDEVNREAEDTGSITITGGELSVDVTAVASKAVKADGDVVISGGRLQASVSGGGKWDSAESKTKASACISLDGALAVSGEADIDLAATGAGGKGISGDGAFVMSGGELRVTTSGGMFAYVNGATYENYTGNADRLASSQKNSPKGVRCVGDITIDGGKINVVTSGNGGEGIESKSTLTVNGGEIYVKAYDDALNSASHMYINGGSLTAIATNNDGLDSNGNMYIAGGYVMAFGAGSPECGIDANEEEGYSVHFTGGTLLAVGGRNSVPSSGASTQPYISGSVSVSGGASVAVKSGSDVLASFSIPAEYVAGSSGPRFGPGGPGGGWGPGGGTSGGGFLVSCPGLESGTSYTVSVGTASTSLNAR